MSNSDSDEEFGPLLPGLNVPASGATPGALPDCQPALTPASVMQTTEEMDAERAHKRERLEAPLPDYHAIAKESAVQGLTTEGSDHGSPGAMQWTTFADQGFPTAWMYERSFAHTVLPTDEEGGAEGNERKMAQGNCVVSAPSHRIHSMDVLYDELGALILTVDERGLLRVWRKLPRGVFFLGETTRLFGRRSTTKEGDALSRVRYHVRCCSIMQWVLLIAVREAATDADDNRASACGEKSLVQVEVRQINPSTMTVERRSTVSFYAPIARIREEIAHDSSYTREPVLLQHRFEPHIAMFVDLLPPDDAGSSGPASQSGVVVFPCFPIEIRDGAPAVRLYRPTRLSTAHPVVCCTQRPLVQTSGQGTPGSAGNEAGISPCVLVDAKGIIDYAVITACIEEASVVVPGSAATTGLTLKVIGGLGGCVPKSTESRILRQWICFDRRSQTDFFALLRDARQLETQNGVSTHVTLLPCAVTYTASASYWAVMCLRCTFDLPSPILHENKTETTTVVLTSEVDQCIYLFEAASGKCVGKGAKAVGASRLKAELPSSEPVVSWLDRLIHNLARKADVTIAIAEGNVLHSSKLTTGSVPGLFIFVPELTAPHLQQLWGTHPSAPITDCVQGRAVNVWQAVLPNRHTMGTAAPAVIEALPHAVGRLERFLRQGTHRLRCNENEADPPRASSGNTLPRYTLSERSRSSLCPLQDGLRAPVLLLRRPVLSSQSLKDTVARSEVGVKLTPEEVKRLLAPPRCATETHVGGTSSDVTRAVHDSLLLTSSLGPCDTALLIYSQHNISLTPAVLRMVGSIAASPGEGNPSYEEREALDSGTASRCAPLASKEAQHWSSLLRDVHHDRDFACHELRHQHDPTTVEPAPAKEASAVGEPVMEDEEGATVGENGVPAPINGSADSEDEHVYALLCSSVPAMSTRARSSGKCEGLVHIQGYGTVRVHFLPEVAPTAVENFTRLAQRGYYNQLTFHRVIPAVLIQGGCPHGDGTGGRSAFEGGAPFADEGVNVFPFFTNTAHVSWLCMANAGKDTNGSQFFITVPGAAAMPWLNGCHTVFGYVVDGKDVVCAVSNVPRRQTEESPLQPVVMERVDIVCR